jgi:signal transduction histidine kinase
MADAPDWPKVLSLTVHEFRTPLTVVAGYLRMLSTDRVGPLSDAQLRVIQEAEKSCARLSTLLTEVSDVAHFHQGRLTFLRTPAPLADILDGVDAGAPERPAGLVREGGEGGAMVNGDAARLRQALSAVATAVSREIMEDDALHMLTDIREGADGREAFIAIGSEPVARRMLAAPRESLAGFDATRGGSGLSLVVARQVIEDHGGRLFGAPGEQSKVGAAIALPLS